VYPSTGPTTKALGRLLAEPFGPISSWQLTYTKEGPSLVVSTARGHAYALCKPQPTYRKVYASLDEQARLAWHVLLVSRRRAGRPWLCAV
jgi:hypothetical protein